MPRKRRRKRPANAKHMNLMSPKAAGEHLRWTIKAEANKSTPRTLSPEERTAYEQELLQRTPKNKPTKIP